LQRTHRCVLLGSEHFFVCSRACYAWLGARLMYLRGGRPFPAQVAERTIMDDLEHLIAKTVDPKRADYAVISGVQIHSWGRSFDDETPNLEFIAPATVYCVVAGERTYLDLRTIPSLTPRQIRALSRGPAAEGRSPAADDEVSFCVCVCHFVSSADEIKRRRLRCCCMRCCGICGRSADKVLCTISAALAGAWAAC
jgi:hypothetical protein